jgi:hypothetical protein
MRLLPRELRPDETSRVTLGELQGLGSLGKPRALG